MRIAIVGGGIAGLAAARALQEQGLDPVLFESTDRLGGKLRLDTVGDLTLDVGAESMLARRPEAVALAEAVGLASDIVHPDTTQASILAEGSLHPLPRTVMGIPTGPVDFVSVEQHSVPLPDHDISVAEYVRERAGEQVLDRLVAPLLAGVYAGDSDRLSLAAAGEQLKALGADPLAAAAQLPEPDGSPVFAGIRGGVGRLAAAIAAGLAEVRTEVIVRGLERDRDRWLLRSSAGDERVDAVLLATPAPATSRLLAEIAPRASFALADVAVASVVIVSFVFDQELDLPGSGFLVSPGEPVSIKASTFASNKWGWLKQPGRTVLRASLGRAGEPLLYDDATMTELALADLRSILGTLPAPVATHVQRWGGGLPQYAVGHREMVDLVAAEMKRIPGLALAGATYRGVGIPAVIASAQGAVENLLADLGDLGRDQ
ncbi:MAG TPA: FAD-dependent oxidoreductase [Aeromicrobium sp.]|nr:FAD-dependent oxidoreductase [Aeromicrobium sp.]HKY57269.1 FAD-dependent oxidoreductase [Aeromicrobium sp.]